MGFAVLASGGAVSRVMRKHTLGCCIWWGSQSTQKNEVSSYWSKLV